MPKRKHPTRQGAAAGIVRGCDKDLRPVVRKALKQGWLVATSNTHVHLVSPVDGHREPVPMNTHNNSLRKAFTARLVKHGLQLAS